MGSHAALIAELVTELEQANEGDRELSDQVLRALGWKLKQLSLSPPGMHGWQAPDGKWPGDPPDPTRSLDDAVDLVPEGMGWSIEDTGYGLIYRKAKIEGEAGHPILAETNGYGGIAPSIGICILILKAVEAGDG